MSTPFSEAAGLPVNQAQPVTTYSPLTLSAPRRPAPLEVKASAPVTGDDRPVIVLSHGHGESNFLSSLHGYSPLVDFWAAHGFVVLQPTHLDFTGLGLRDSNADGAPLFWRSRVEDVRVVLDHLKDIGTTVPGLSGRVDHTKITAVGHSLGPRRGHAVRHDRQRPRDRQRARPARRSHCRRCDHGRPGIRGRHGRPRGQALPDLSEISFDTMTTQSLVVIGENDHNPMFSDDENWRADAYHCSRGDHRTLLTMHDAGHMLGWVSGYDAAETTDENPDRVAALRTLVWANLRSSLDQSDTSWKTPPTPWLRCPDRGDASRPDDKPGRHPAVSEASRRRRPARMCRPRMRVLDAHASPFVGGRTTS